MELLPEEKKKKDDKNTDGTRNFNVSIQKEALKIRAIKAQRWWINTQSKKITFICITKQANLVKSFYKTFIN